MSSIELTEEHKSKLLEMCNKLFPEYHEIILTKQKFLNFGFKNHKSHTSRISNMSIHWFEFCVNHLSKKIFSIDGKIMCGYDYFINNVRYTKKHPINYLYEEFKKLK